jgi:hypothetical protein
LVEEYKKKQDEIFWIFQITQQGMYELAEAIAEKEIEHDPIAFIKRESLQLSSEGYLSM